MPSAPLKNNYSVQQTFLGRNYFENGTYTNSTGSTVTLAMGTVMGRVLATGLVLPNLSTATDGSEMPRMILGDSYTVANGASATVALCIRGKVNQAALTLGAGDTWGTIVRTVSTGGGTIQDLLIANSDITLEPNTELSNYDN